MYKKNISVNPVKRLFVLFILLFVISTIQAKRAEDILPKWEKEIREQFIHNPVKAIELSDSLLKYGSETGDEEIIAKSYYFLGIGNYYLNRSYLSNEYYRKALNTYYAQNDEEFQGKCWNNIGINYDVLSKNSEALNAYLKSLRISEKQNDSLSIAQSWINIGLLDTRVGKFDRAEMYLRKALKYFISHHDTLNIGLCYQNLAVTYNNQLDFNKTLDFYYKSLEAYQAVDYKYGITQVLLNMGIQYIRKDEHAKAEQYLDRALVSAREIESEYLISAIYIQKANISPENSKQKLIYYKAARESFLKEGNYESSMPLDLEMCDLFAANGDLKNYQETMNDYRTKFEEFIKRKNIDRYEEFQAIYESQAKQNLITIQAQKLDRRRNMLIISGIIILMLVSFGIVVTLLTVRMRKYIVALYQKNLDIKNAVTFPIKEISEEQNSVSEEADTEEKKNTETNYPKLAELYQEIVRIFEEEKIFRKHELSVSELSAKLNTNDKYISLAINNHGNGNFNAFVNAYRINEARKIIARYGKSISIKELADKSGYKSLNTFYKNFKEITGLTPSQYIELSEDKNLNH